jgi:hypothetical protein
MLVKEAPESFFNIPLPTSTSSTSTSTSISTCHLLLKKKKLSPIALADTAYMTSQLEKELVNEIRDVGWKIRPGYILKNQMPAGEVAMKLVLRADQKKRKARKLTREKIKKEKNQQQQSLLLSSSSPLSMVEEEEKEKEK